ncbi:MAG TPA: alpha/beta fold hydrolase, partial [Pirellulales bacterium]|nr:alpha/beta fold hydrolase [Pirellulales bacterium]
KLLVYRDDAGKSHPVTTPADWGLRRSRILTDMQSVMGPVPDPSVRVPLDVEWGEEIDCGKYVRRKLTFASEPNLRVPAWLLVPKKLKGPAPAMLCLHPTNKLGKDQTVGLDDSKSRHYAVELADRGYVCLVPDYPSFGDYPYDFASTRTRSAAKSGTMKAIWDNMRAIDLLETLPEVDNTKIGAIGHSLGGHNALFTAALDLRIRAVVSSCGFTAFAKYKGGDLKGWSQDRYMPRVASAYHNDPEEMPFDFHEVVAALAPRPFFASAPANDSNFDNAGVREVMAAAGTVYELLDAKDNLVAEYPDAEHDFPDAQREAAYAFLDKAVKNKKGK